MEKRNIVYRRRNSALQVFVFIVGLSSSLLSKSEDDVDYLFSLDLKELLQMKVEVASKSGQIVSEAPSSVTIFTKAEIHNMGVSTLEELLNFVPGMQVARTEEVGSKINTVSVRGRRTIHSSPEVLFLIDGQRLNGAWDGGALVFNNHMSVDGIKQVEVIRGPGSALYGSNAFLAVVNVVTDTSSNEASLSVGERGARDFWMNVSGQEEAFKWALFARSYIDDGHPTIFLDGGASTRDPFQKTDFLLSVETDSLKMHFRDVVSKQNDFAQFGAIADGINKDVESSRSLRLSYHKKFSEALDIDISGGWINNNSDFLQAFIAPGIGYAIGLFESPDNGAIGGTLYDAEQMDISIDSKYKFNENHMLQGGITYREEEINNITLQNNFTINLDPSFSFSESYDWIVENQRLPWLPWIPTSDFTLVRDNPLAEAQPRDVLGFYLQDKMMLSEQLTAYIGARYDDYSDFGDNVSPRAALIYETEAFSTFKLMYGEAFRAPSLRQLNNVDLTFIGNPGLRPEIAKTIELAWIQKWSELQTSLTYYKTTFEDAVVLEPIDAQFAVFNVAFAPQNSGDIELTGMEFEAIWSPVQNLLIRGTVSKLDSLASDDNFLSDTQASIIVNYAHEKWNFNLNGFYYSETTHPTGNSLSAYNVLNGNVRYKLSNKVELQFNIQNLLDEIYSTNTLETDFVNGIPSRGRQASIGFAYNF